MYFVKSKVGPSGSYDIHILIIGKWIIKDGGEKNGYNTNVMECGEQTIYCAFERIWP